MTKGDWMQLAIEAAIGAALMMGGMGLGFLIFG